MKREPRRARSAWPSVTVLTLTTMAVAACGGASAGSSHSAVPQEFRAACGHPGAHVTVHKVPVTIPHADCDLTGVEITYPGHGGATVPHDSGTIGNSLGFTLTVDPSTYDVTVSASGPPGNQ